MEFSDSSPKPDYSGILVAKGIDLTIPPIFTDLSRLPADTRHDRLTDLPVWSDSLRHTLVSDFSDCLQKGENWACLHSDLDQLKSANKPENGGRPFGDECIKWGAARTTQLIQAAGFSPDVKMVAVRSSDAADEVYIWFFNPNSQDLQKIRKIQESLKEEFILDKPHFILSASSGLIVSDDEIIKQAITQTRNFLKSNPTKLPFDLFNEVRALADKAVAMEKGIKDKSRLDPERLINGQKLREFIRILRDDFGGTRISGEVLEILAQLQSMQTVLALKDNVKEETYRLMLADLGVTEEELKSAKTPQDTVSLFQGIFGKEE